MKIYIISQIFFLLTISPFALSVSSVNAAEIALDETIDLAIENSLHLKEVDARLQMKLSECWQAGLCPNPAIAFIFNEIRFPGKKSVLGCLQATFEFSQLIELGNKRTARQNVIAAEASTLLWESEFVKEEIVKKVTETYADAFAAQKKLGLLDQAYQNATSIVDCTKEKVDNGKVSPILHRKSVLARHTIAMEQKKNAAALASIKRQLSLLCGETFDCRSNISEPQIALSAPLPPENYDCLIFKNAEIAQLVGTQLVAYYNYDLQRANRVPNVIVSTGLEHDSPYGGCRLTLQFGMELPVYNRNQGNISRAAWESHAIAYRIENLERELAVRGQDLYADLTRNFETIELITRELIPANQEILEIHKNREKGGKEDCLEGLEAIKGLLDLQLQYLDALNEFYHLRANLRFLYGSDLETMM